MKNITALTIWLLINLPPCFGQTTSVYKTIKKRNFHYADVTTETAMVYKMGKYIDKGVSGFAVLKMDTLYKLSETYFKGKYYSLNKVDGNFILHTDKAEKLAMEIEPDLDKVNQELNNAYYLRGYFDLGEKLNNEFPLYHYTFRNGFYGWDKLEQRSYNHEDFMQFTDNEINVVYDSISKKQARLTKASSFIKENSAKLDYSQLRDSLRILPVDYRTESEYFGQSVYNIAKANPESFYKILEDFPSDKTKVYFAVEGDKELIRQLKAVEGYDSLKKEFIKEYKFDRSFTYRIIATYAIAGGLLTWLILSQK